MEEMTTAARIRLVRANNPSALTGTGTNTWLVGEGVVTLIDPGPALPDHLAAILAALDPGEQIDRILVTHAHLDHSALTQPLAKETGAPVLAFGRAEDGRSPVMQALLEEGFSGGGEGADKEFIPDAMIKDGDRLDLPGSSAALEVIHSPGHMGGHLAFALGDVLFSGDHVMGWSSTLVSPPDGDMAAYMQSLARLSARAWSRFMPGHGGAVEDPAARLAELTAHRRQREAQILSALHEAPDHASGLAARIYTDTPATLLAAASRNVLSHLIDLSTRNQISAEEKPSLSTRYHPV
jgi:glyoxylase-like metal-dependent hydrolase (beta-lactamase superfamily II)